MNTQLKRRIAFAMAMGMLTTGIISFALLGMNKGFSNGFLEAWLRSWGVGYATVIPVILLVGPRVQAQVERLIR